MLANVPGMKPDEIKVEVEDDRVTISGEHAEESEKEEGAYLRRERHAGAFSRSCACRTRRRQEGEGHGARGRPGRRDPGAVVKAPQPVTITPTAP